MKWCFLVNNIDLLMEFTGKLAFNAVQESDECILVFNGKLAEYRKTKFFPKNIKTISKIDWLAENYDKNKKNISGISWKEFFATFERKSDLLRINYHTSTEIISQLYQFIDFVFKTEKPDMVINEAPANIFTNIAYYFCQKYNITYIGIIGSKFVGKIDVYNKPHTLSLYEKTFNSMSNGSILLLEREFAKNFTEDFVSHRILPPYMDFQMEFSYFAGPVRYLKRQFTLAPHFLKYILKRGLFSKFDYESESYLKYNILRPFRSLARNLRAIYFKNQYKRINNEDKFFLYPLHFHPEASTLVLATYFSDQLNTIKNIAFSLPFPYKLYVKEHPVAVGTRLAYFYKQIKKLPNVTLISAYENNKELIQKSKGIVTLTSTVGMEAAFLGRPVYVLGDVFYDYHPLCRKISSFEELRKKINSDLMKDMTTQAHSKTENIEDINCRFVISYFRNTIPGDVAEAIKVSDSNLYENIYESIKKIVLSLKE